MTKHILTSLAIIGMATTAAPLAAQAEFVGPGVSESIKTVADAKNAYDDTYVELTGHIVNKVEDETYMFRDDSGDIMIEIDDDDFRGQKVTPETTIMIKGEVDKGWGDLEIDVEWLEIKK